jgi:crossover junction endodeoxyribonuclease RusA
MIVSAEGRAYRNLIETAKVSIVDANGNVSASLLGAKRFETLAGRLDVRINLTMPDRRRRDLDNAMKPLLDALQHAGVYEDDSQIDRLLIERNPNGTPRAVIEIKTWREQRDALKEVRTSEKG